MQKATVVLLIDEENRVCLARKKQAIHSELGEISYSLGLYNGYGGKMEEGDESIEDTALRELFDESTVSAQKEDLVHKGTVLFTLVKEGERKPFMEVHFYTLSVWEGEPKESPEMGSPTFFAKTNLPYDEMMPADKVLFEKMFEEKDISGEVALFGKEAQPEIHFLCE